MEFLSLKEAAQAPLSLHLSKYHIVGNHMTWLLLLYVKMLHLNANNDLFRIRGLNFGQSLQLHSYFYEHQLLSFIAKKWDNHQTKWAGTFDVDLSHFSDFAGPSLGGFLNQEIGFEWMATYTGAICLFTVS